MFDPVKHFTLLARTFACLLHVLHKLRMSKVGFLRSGWFVVQWSLVRRRCSDIQSHFPLLSKAERTFLSLQICQVQDQRAGGVFVRGEQEQHFISNPPLTSISICEFVRLRKREVCQRWTGGKNRGRRLGNRGGRGAARSGRREEDLKTKEGLTGVELTGSSGKSLPKVFAGDSCVWRSYVTVPLWYFPLRIGIFGMWWCSMQSRTRSSAFKEFFWKFQELVGVLGFRLDSKVKRSIMWFSVVGRKDLVSNRLIFCVL